MAVREKTIWRTWQRHKEPVSIQTVSLTLTKSKLAKAYTGFGLEKNKSSLHKYNGTSKLNKAKRKKLGFEVKLQRITQTDHAML